MSISLQRRSVVSEPFEGERHTWPLEIKAVSNEPGIPNEIFVYHRDASDVDDPRDPYPGDRFECVASVHQLATLPAVDPESPGQDSQVPFYRTDTLFFHCLSLSDADDLWRRVREDVADLVENQRAAAALEEDEEVVVGLP